MKSVKLLGHLRGQNLPASQALNNTDAGLGEPDANVFVESHGSLTAPDLPSDAVQRHISEEKLYAEIARKHPASTEILCQLIAGIRRAFQLSTSGSLDAYLRFARSVRPIEGGPHGQVLRSAGRADSSIERPNFATVGSVGWNPVRIHAAADGKVFNELAAMTVALAHGSDVVDLCRTLWLDETLRERLADIVDVRYLSTLVRADLTTQVFDESRLHTPSPDWLALRNDARVYRNAPSFVDEVSSDLPEALQPSTRELEFQKQNEGYDAALRSGGERIPRHYGRLIWQVQKKSNFGSTADRHQRPTVSGPSSTSYAVGVLARLFLPAMQNGKLAEFQSPEKALLELMRFAVAGYLVTVDHHSLLEIDYGFEPLGLSIRYAHEEALVPFSMDDTLKLDPRIGISNAQVAGSLGWEKKSLRTACFA